MNPPSRRISSKGALNAKKGKKETQPGNNVRKNSSASKADHRAVEIVKQNKTRERNKKNKNLMPEQSTQGSLPLGRSVTDKKEEEKCNGLQPEKRLPASRKNKDQDRVHREKSTTCPRRR